MASPSVSVAKGSDGLNANVSFAAVGSLGDGVNGFWKGIASTDSLLKGISARREPRPPGFEVTSDGDDC